MSNPKILFAGYKVPHPLLHELVIKVRTDGEVQPIEAMVNSIDNLLESTKNIADAFKKAVAEKRQMGDDDGFSDAFE